MRTHEVPTGPFEREPLDLGRLLSEGFSPAVDGAEVVRLLAADGWSVAQAVGGWVRRAAERG